MSGWPGKNVSCFDFCILYSCILLRCVNLILLEGKELLSCINDMISYE